MLGFVDDVKGAGSIMIPMQPYDNDGLPKKTFDFVDHGKKTPAILEVLTLYVLFRVATDVGSSRSFGF